MRRLGRLLLVVVFPVVSGCALVAKKSVFSMSERQKGVHLTTGRAFSCYAEGLSVGSGFVSLRPKSEERWLWIGPPILPLVPLSFAYGQEISELHFRLQADRALSPGVFRAEYWSLTVGEQSLPASFSQESNGTPLLIFRFAKQNAEVFTLRYHDPDRIADDFGLEYNHRLQTIYLPLVLMPMDAGPCLP